MLRTKKWLEIALISGVLAMAGCGDDTDTPATTDAGTSADTGTSTDSGTDGSTAADTGTSAPEPVQCGATVCNPIQMTIDDTPLGILPACCVRDDVCGVELASANRDFMVTVPSGCTEIEAEGRIEPSCAAEDFVFPAANNATVEMAGCCLPNDQCGVVVDLSEANIGVGTLSVVNLGCQATSDFVRNAETPASCVFEEAPAE